MKVFKVLIFAMAMIMPIGSIAANVDIHVEPHKRGTLIIVGFGLLPSAIVDQHFSRRSRDNRLVSAVLDYPQLLGVGIDEETALIVRPVSGCMSCRVVLVSIQSWGEWEHGVLRRFYESVSQENGEVK